MDDRCDVMSFSICRLEDSKLAPFSITFMALWTISANFASRTFISVFCATLMTALDRSLLAVEFGTPVLRCTRQNYEWLTMTFERRHCVETLREMDVGNTPLYRFDSQTHRFPGIGVNRCRSFSICSLTVFPFATVIAQLNILAEFDC